ncbi:MAG: hypothetical protein ABW171_12785, partial [Steroidobacter sp.]
MDSRKQAVSIRMSAADIRSVKRLAERLGVRDSDVIRFAVKVMLGRLAPLHDLGVKGKSLVPVFVESGTDIFRHFELDAMRLDSIINQGADEDARVDSDDIQLIAMSGIQQSYARLRLSSIGHAPKTNGNGHDKTAGRAGKSGEEDELGNSLRKYLYEKYVYRNNLGGPRPPVELESHHEG